MFFLAPETEQWARVSAMTDGVSVTFGTVGLVVPATASLCAQCLSLENGVAGTLELPSGPYCKY